MQLLNYELGFAAMKTVIMSSKTPSESGKSDALQGETVETPEVFTIETPVTTEEILAIFSEPVEEEPLDPDLYGIDIIDPLPEKNEFGGDAEETMEEYMKRMIGEEEAKAADTLQIDAPIEFEEVVFDEAAADQIIEEMLPEIDVAESTRLAEYKAMYDDGCITEREFKMQEALITGVIDPDYNYNLEDEATGVPAALLNDIEAVAKDHDAMEEDKEAEAANYQIDEEMIAHNKRESLLQQIQDFYQLLDMPTMGRNFELMDDDMLEQHLYLLKANNGGSFDMAKLLQAVEVEYDALMRSETLAMRMKLVEQQGSDVIATMQKMRQIIGNDFVINKTRAADYHNMLKSAISFISTIHDKIAAIGGKLGLKLPVNEFNQRIDSIPIVEGMPADPRVAMYVLNVLMAYLDKFDTLLGSSNKQVARSEERIKYLESREKHLTKNMEDAQQHAQALSAEYERFRANNSHWILKDQYGNILRQRYQNEPILYTKDLDLRGTEDTALPFGSKTLAREWAKRLMGTRRFRGRQLKVYRVSIVEDNN